MKGTNRLGQSDSNPDSNDSTCRSKRVMAAPPFDVHRAESSRQHLTAELPLDVHRAELSHLHVRALNTQFASWVQLQLRDHPDELWQDGVQDYLNHAAHIMDKFKDVVEWLKANAAKAGSVSIADVPSSEEKLIAETKNNELKQLDKSGFARESSTASFTSLWSSGPFSSSQTSVLPVPFFSSQTSVLPGSQSSALVKREASDDLDDENDLAQPSSPSLKKTDEKGIVVVHEVKCKVYVKPDSPADKSWKDMGMGQLCIKCKEGASKATKESKPTIVVRNDVGKVFLNALLYTGIKMNMQKNTITTIFHTSGGGNEASTNEIAVARTYLLRMKTEEEAKKLATTIQEYAPAA